MCTDNTAYHGGFIATILRGHLQDAQHATTVYMNKARDSSPHLVLNSHQTIKMGVYCNHCILFVIWCRGWINILGIMVVRAIGFSSYASETTVYSLRCVEVKETHLFPGGRAPENTRARVPPPCVCACTCVEGGVCVCVCVCDAR